MPRGRNRSRLLEAGHGLFLTQGFRGSGVQQITDSAGVPKGSFYNYFHSKQEFGAAVLADYCRDLQDEIEAALVNSDGLPLARLERLFDGFVERERECGFARGCLAGSLCQEMAASDKRFREVVEEHFRRVQGIVAELLFEAQQAGDLDPGQDPADLAGFLYESWQGALLRMKAARTDRPLQQFKQLAFGRLLAAPSRATLAQPVEAREAE